LQTSSPQTSLYRRRNPSCASPTDATCCAAAVALSLVFFTATLAWQVPAATAASASGCPGFRARAPDQRRSRASGKSALSIDVFLASKARDGAIHARRCRGDDRRTGSRLRRLREHVHDLRQCKPRLRVIEQDHGVDAPNRLGLRSVGEIDLDNGDTATRLSLLGSRLEVDLDDVDLLHDRPRHGGLEVVEQPLEHHPRQLHPVGCGGWASGSTYYYDCLFAKGGPAPSGLKSHRQVPFSNPLPATPTPKRRCTRPPSGFGRPRPGYADLQRLRFVSGGTRADARPFAGGAGVPLPLDGSAVRPLPRNRAVARQR